MQEVMNIIIGQTLLFQFGDQMREYRTEIPEFTAARLARSVPAGIVGDQQPVKYAI